MISESILGVKISRVKPIKSVNPTDQILVHRASFYTTFQQHHHYRSIQQYCQQSVSKQLTKFDYGTEGNLAKYGQATPPVYKADRLEVQNWAIIAGTYDALADPTTIQRLIETTESPEPVKLIVALGFNHVDFFGAVENDKYVNLPYLAELDKHSDF